MIKLLPTVIFLIFLSGCGSTPEYNYDAETIIVEDQQLNTEENIIGVDDSEFTEKNLAYNIRGDARNNKSLINDLKTRNLVFILYFPYDDFSINEQTIKKVIEHANFMQDYENLELRIEGHADERGTREYNLALGENRALRIKEILSLYGLDSKVDVVSYGEEKPISKLHSEEGWGQNRRVEFIYK